MCKAIARIAIGCGVWLLTTADAHAQYNGWRIGPSARYERLWYTGSTVFQEAGRRYQTAELAVMLHYKPLGRTRTQYALQAGVSQIFSKTIDSVRIPIGIDAGVLRRQAAMYHADSRYINTRFSVARTLRRPYRKLQVLSGGSLGYDVFWQRAEYFITPKAALPGADTLLRRSVISRGMLIRAGAGTAFYDLLSVSGSLALAWYPRPKHRLELLAGYTYKQEISFRTFALGSVYNGWHAGITYSRLLKRNASGNDDSKIYTEPDTAP